MLRGQDELRTANSRLGIFIGPWRDSSQPSSRFLTPPTWNGLARFLRRKAAGSSDGPFRVWVPECGTGELAYALAMLLSELFSPVGRSFEIFATDERAESLLAARAASYPLELQAYLPPQAEKYFQQGKTALQVIDAVRRRVILGRHTLAEEPPLARLQLICCQRDLGERSPEVQQLVLAGFHLALNPGGHLQWAAGKMPEAGRRWFRPVSPKWNLYRPENSLAISEANPEKLSPTGDKRPNQLSSVDIERRVLKEDLTALELERRQRATALQVLGQALQIDAAEVQPQQRWWHPATARRISLRAALTTLACTANSSEALVRGALQQLCSRGDWPAGHAVLVDLESQHWKDSDIWEFSSSGRFSRLVRARRKHAFAPSETALPQVVRNGEPYFLTSAKPSPDEFSGDTTSPLAEALWKVKLAAFAVVPIKYQNQVVAVFELFHSQAQAVELRAELFEAAQAIGETMAPALTRLQAAESLAQRERQYRRTVEHTGLSTLTIQNGSITFASPAAASLVGADHVEKMVGRPLLDFSFPEQVSNLAAWLKQLELGEQAPPLQTRLRRLDHEPIEVELTGKAFTESETEPSPMGLALRLTPWRESERFQLEQQLAHFSGEQQRQLGQQLHDSVAQQLTGVAMLADNLRKMLVASQAPQAHDAAGLVQQIGIAQQQVRRLSHGLMSVEVDATGLTSALEELAGASGQLYDVPCYFRCLRPVRLEDNLTATHLYHIAQESLHNAVKHGRPKQIVITLDAQAQGVKLTIRDDGSGFSSSARSESGMGRRIMRYRAQVIGAALEIQSRPGHGVAVICTLPRKR